jgi:hypothetical protein
MIAKEKHSSLVLQRRMSYGDKKASDDMRVYIKKIANPFVLK